MRYYYMIVPTKYHWNISLKKIQSKDVVKNARNATHFVWQTFFHWISRVCQIRNIKYIHQNLRYYETIVQLLYFSGNHLPLVMIYKNKMVTLKNLILRYIGMTNQYIEKKVSCWNKCSVVRSDIETVWCMFHETHLHCPMNLFAPFWHSHIY